MKKKKEITVNELKFTIEYNDAETPIEKINKTNSGQLIWILFKPINKLSEQMGIDILNDNESNFKEEIKEIIQENKEFYNNFKVSYEFNRRSTNLYRDGVKTYIIGMTLYLKVEIKD